MAHRFNCENNRVEPKPSARERTWYRWRTRNGIMIESDQNRFEKHQGIIAKIKAAILNKKRK